jgi:protein-S-isoprenylcysteine O-methyltransferase Ste14
MQRNPRATPIPKHLLVLLVGFVCASLAHFVHNAEYISYYPGMPAWLTREHVYAVWLAQAGLGLAGLWLWRRGWPAVGAAVIGIYGALGLDGLLHYTLALCSEHTLVANITIWSEVSLGLMLLLAGMVQAVRSWTPSVEAEQAL